ncbi:hypothetical protein DPMN_072768 [Dreissena polymorpha]|uniref:Uncharacterized protein n=1 Tax=Dreissena polymorpha TaxID=45954 RepID=A0A9D4BXX1_DREPO|nr:hypothetical protein DPMN_072768 [Dreissena polymorpha]
MTARITPPPGGHAFLPIQTIFELNRRIWKTNVQTNFHEDFTKNVTSRVFRCFHYIHIEKTAPPPGGHFHDDWANICHIRNTAPPPGIIGTNVLTKFHEDRTINVASRVFTRQMLTTDAQRTAHDGQKAITKAHHEHVVLRWAKKSAPFVI